MKRFLLAFALVFAALSGEAAQIQRPHGRIDPYLKDYGGYGYTLVSNDRYTAWWAEGAYKMMEDTPLPTRRAKKIELKSARRESESFILVVRPKVRIENFELSVDDLRASGGVIGANGNVVIRRVDYVKVWRAANEYSYDGMWPDPLPEAEGLMTLAPDTNYAFWITVTTPPNAAAGQYKSELRMNDDGRGHKIPLNLTVWNFTLPRVPSMRSDVGVSLDAICRYDNVPEQHRDSLAAKVHTFFDSYRITPRYAVDASLHETISGVEWAGGLYDSEVRTGDSGYSMRAEDMMLWEAFSATTVEPIMVDWRQKYVLELDFMSPLPGNGAAVVFQFLDEDGRELEWTAFEDQMVVLRDDNAQAGCWSHTRTPLPPFPQGATQLYIHLSPYDGLPNGARTGVAWYDNVRLWCGQTEQDALCGRGDFNVNVDDIKIEFDIDAFAARVNAMFDKYGFTNYNLILKGIGQGSAKYQVEGSIAGFQFGTSEYEHLMHGYLGEVQQGLERTGLLGREIIYWFDEPWVLQYPFVVKYHEMIKRHAPRIKTFLTEHLFAKEYNDANDIACMKWNYTDQDKIDEMNGDGREPWSYICCEPRAPYICEMIDAEAINFRVWLWGSWAKNLHGVLLWHVNDWTFNVPTPENKHRDERGNPLTDFTYCLFNGWNSGYGDGVLIYPNNPDLTDKETEYLREPVPSIRLELLRDGIEDYEYFVMLQKAADALAASDPILAAEARKLLEIPSLIYKDEMTYSKNPQYLLSYRDRLGAFLDKLSRR
ncbi:MAG: DUF4091 domain-containing protein [Bacteroidales bacterium]|nr:DUF4091 domain-containing protein [Bacteroidales bacterium]